MDSLILTEFLTLSEFGFVYYFVRDYNMCMAIFLQTAFVVDEVSNIIKEAVEGTIGGNAYQHNKINQWTSNVVEQCLNQLTKLGKPFKYIGKLFSPSK